MTKFPVVIAALTAVFAPIVSSAPAAASEDTSSVTGAVVVFSSEVLPLNTWDDPSGCHQLPIAAHVLINETDQPVHTFLDPLCLAPSMTVAPDHGAHVAPGTGSFSVGA